MTDRRQRIIAQLEDNLEVTLDLFGSLSAEALGRPVYQNGAQWTVKQVPAHFITIEQSMQMMIELARLPEISSRHNLRDTA